MNDAQAKARCIELMRYTALFLKQLSDATQEHPTVPLKHIPTTAVDVQGHMNQALKGLMQQAWMGNLREHTPQELNRIIAEFEKLGVSL